MSEQQRYRYAVDSVWGTMEGHSQIFVGATVIDIDKGDDAQWDIYNFDQGEMVGGFTGRRIGVWASAEVDA